ncbi:hypothetical protein BDV34DRAFT_106568 [Aspergillus parasiticus]|uniref:Uncharacterized protein n=1 Tax=Aspergillus parasiticus TaxID=5067 RepID=A0A5N6E0U4_ASPPA|nr:hypothetical protein BDV34DRAFT_106568 [Aspergillus parasiticus]
MICRPSSFLEGYGHVLSFIFLITLQLKRRPLWHLTATLSVFAPDLTDQVERIVSHSHTQPKQIAENMSLNPRPNGCSEESKNYAAKCQSTSCGS